MAKANSEKGKPQGPEVQIRVGQEVAPMPPLEVRKLLGPAPVLDGEEAGDYYALLTGLGRDLGAKDIADWVQIESLATVLWRAQQFRVIRSVRLRQERRSKPKIFKHDPMLSQHQVFDAYYAIHESTRDESLKERLSRLFQIADGRLRTGVGPSPEFALKQLAELVGVKPVAPPPEPEMTPAGQALFNADEDERLLRLVKPIDDEIERLENRAQKILEGIDKRRMFQLRFNEVTASYVVHPAANALDNTAKPMLGGQH